MTTFLAQNQFISNSVSHVPVDAGSAAVSPCPHSTTAAVQIADPDGGYMGHRLSPALGTSVGIAATDPCQEPVAATPIDHINEIFFYARKLMKQAPRFVLDEAAFMAEVEETPLFLREDGYLQRREA